MWNTATVKSSLILLVCSLATDILTKQVSAWSVTHCQQFYQEIVRWPTVIISTVTSKRFARLKTVYSARNGAPTKAEEWFLYSFVKGEKWPSQCWLRPFYSQLGQLTCAWHVMDIPAHLSLSRLFASAKPIFKRNAPTDNMWPKLHDDYTHHQ